MKIVLQRVRRAGVTVDGNLIASIGRGYVLLLGISEEDNEATCEKWVDKIKKLRINEDSEGKTNLSIDDVGGELMVVSQFTLLADCRKGNRPSFLGAGSPEEAKRLFEHFVEVAKTKFSKVESGIFGADMAVEIINDGPFTLVMQD